MPMRARKVIESVFIDRGILVFDVHGINYLIFCLKCQDKSSPLPKINLSEL